MSETVANDFSGFLDSLTRPRVQGVTANAGPLAEGRLANATRSSDGVTSGAHDAPLDKVVLGHELAAHHNQSFGWALACCRWDREAAEDVLHSSYLKVLDGKAQFGGRSSFRTWLFAVIRTTARETRRRQWRRGLIWQKYGPETAPSVPETQLRSADAAKLRAELASLPNRQREILHLVFYVDLSISEAAEVMHVSLGTARTHYERGKRRLRQRLDVEAASHG